MRRDEAKRWAAVVLAMTVGLAQETPAAAEKTLDEAYVLLEAGDYEKAVKAFRKAHKREDAPSFRCAIGRATTFNRIEAFKKADKSSQEALELAATSKERAAAYFEKGVALYARGSANDEELKASEHALRKVLEESGGGWNQARFPLGVILLKQERDDEGVAVLEAYLAAAPPGKAADLARSYVENPLRARAPVVPEFEVVTLDGASLTPQDLEGKVVLLDFWGTWCGPCVASIPHLRRLSQRSEDDPFVIVGFAADSDETTLREFISEHEISWPQFMDARREVARGIFQVESYPTYVLVDHEGMIVYRSSGWSDRIGDEIDFQVSKAIRGAMKASD